MEVNPKYRLLTFMCIFMLCCSTGNFSIQDRFEGIRGDIFRIFVRFDIPDFATVTEESQFFETLDTAIVQAAKDRMSLLIAGISDTGTAPHNQKISVDKNSVVIVFKKCTDTSCEACVDFPLK